jgi:hypothetical protein
LAQEARENKSLLQPPTTTTTDVISTNDTIKTTNTPDSELRGDLQSEGDPEYVDTNSRSMKRSNSSGSWTDQTTKKRTRSSNQGGAKKKKVVEERRLQQESQHHEGPALKKKGSLKQMYVITNITSWTDRSISLLSHPNNNEKQQQQRPAAHTLLFKLSSHRAKVSPVPSPPAPAPAPVASTETSVDQSKDGAHTGDDTMVDVSKGKVESFLESCYLSLLAGHRTL